MNIIIQRHFMERHQPGAKLNNRGYIVLVSVLVIGAVGVAMVFSLMIFGTDSLRVVTSEEGGTKSRALVNACLEEALWEIRQDDNFTGSGSVSLMNGNCDYTVTDQGGESREIQAEAVIDGATRRAKVEIDQINPTINITDWQELAEF
jgi:hypothetical protein